MSVRFERIEARVDTAAILEEIDRQPQLWDLQTGRRNIRVQREARAIPIRGLRKSKMGGRARRDVHESRWTTLSRSFPATVDFLVRMAERFGGELGRAKLVELPPGAQVHPHRDRGEYYARRDRFHLVLRSAGSWMRSGQEEATLREGELWWFDNKDVHEARNPSALPRVHLIFDLEIPAAVRRASGGR